MMRVTDRRVLGNSGLEVPAIGFGGAPLGNRADLPQQKAYADNSVWRIGTPDLVVKTKDIVVKANSPDWWGEIEPVQIPLDEDRYVLAVEIKEVNNATVHNGGRDTVGGKAFRHFLNGALVLVQLELAGVCVDGSVHRVLPDVFGYAQMPI